MAGSQLPPTARSIALLLASAPTIQDSHPTVLHQLLEFSHRYTSQVVLDASVYAEHAGRSGKIDMEDVSLAVQARIGWEFGGRVPKEARSLLHITSLFLLNVEYVISIYFLWRRKRMPLHYPQYQRYLGFDCLRPKIA